MRTALLIVAALAVFVGGYLLVGWLTPDPAVAQREAARVEPRAPRPGEGVIGDIEGIVLRTHDARTGQAVAEVRVGGYRRASDREIILETIFATVLLGDAGIVTLESPLGHINVEAPAAHAERVDADTLGLAETASLEDVKLRWYADADAAATGQAAALMTLSVPRLVYDNTRFGLYTPDTEMDGQTVLSDDVPVTVRGRDYDFDGSGLQVRWDEQTRLPTLVRIAQGKRLVIKTDKPMLPSSIVAAPPQPRGRPLPVQLASLTQASAAPAIVEAGESLVSEAMPTYVARLEEAVIVEQGGQRVLEADWAEAVFSLTREQTPDVAPTKPTTPTTPATSPDPATKPTSQPRPPALAEKDTDEPATPFQPVTVTWNGEFRMERAGPDEPPLTQPDDGRVRMAGSPLVMNRENVEVRARTLRWDRGQDELLLEGTAGEEPEPISLVDAAGNTLLAPSLLVRPETGTATALGAGYAEVRDEQEGLVQIRWQQQCDFLFEPLVEGEGESADPALREVIATGNVAVEHPDLSLTSQRLTMTLAKTGDEGGNPAVERVHAEGDVRCRFQGEGEPASLDCRSLTVDLPEGETGPMLVSASGAVDWQQGDQAFSADRLRATLGEDAAGDLQLDNLVAEGNVSGIDETGRRIAGRRATLTMMPEGRVLQLEGENAGAQPQPAVVSGEGNTLQLSSTQYNLDTGAFRAPAGGTLQTEVPRDTGDPVPAVVTWAGEATGSGGRIDLSEAVTLRAVDGPTTLQVTSNNAAVQLRPGEARQEADNSNFTAPAALGGDLEQVTLSGDLRATAEVREAGKLVRSFDLRAPRLDAWPLEQEGQGLAVRVSVPEAGQALYRDLREEPAEEPQAGDSDKSDALGGFRGSAAFGWQDELEYDPKQRQLTMTGEATVAVEQPGQSVFRLTADRFEVGLESAEPAGGDGEAEERQPLAFRRAVAKGSARFSTEGLSFDAHEVRYDPAARTITAVGGPATPVKVLDADGIPTGSFSELVYNLETGQIDRLRDLSASR